jgi:TRAP-type C4-dicarboxylate transport system permease large subunit
MTLLTGIALCVVVWIVGNVFGGFITNSEFAVAVVQGMLIFGIVVYTVVRMAIEHTQKKLE